MDVDSLRCSPLGRLVEIHHTDPRTGTDYDHFAYVPEPLPREVDLRASTWSKVVAASAALGALKQACAYLPNPSLLIAPALAKEAQATSALEGTYGDLPEVLESRLPGFEPRTPELREINAYVDMAHLGFEWVADRPITMGLLCDLQKILAQASRRTPPDPGRVRKHQVLIGPEGCSIYEARFIPPPPGDLLQAGLDAFEAWLTSDHDLPPLVQAAMAHYQFETLHPFGDGNGRVGRLLVILQMLRAGLISDPALTISPWLLRRRDQYQDHLLQLSQTGDWNPWVDFFSEAVAAQAAAHVAVAHRLVEWLASVRSIVVERRWGGVCAKLVEILIEWPVVSNRLVQERFQVSAPTAKSATDRLVEIGVLTELTGGNYRQLFGATEVMKMVESL